MFQISKLNKTYGKNDTSNHVLRDLSFTIEDKSIICITGASGSGKTTLLNILAALDNEFDGNVLYNNKDLSKLSSKERRNLRLNEYGFVFQSFHLIETLSVHENIILSATAKSNSYDKVFYDEIIARCGLKNKLNSYPHQLSGGEQQRVAVARALLPKPNIVFADEPTGNLDSSNAHKIFQLLSEYAHDHECGLIYVTHEEKFKSFADKHIMLNDGIIANNGE